MTLPRSIVHVFLERARARPSAPALWRKRGSGPYEAISWREYESLVSRFARGLIALGHQPGQAVAILAFNRVEWVVADLAAMGIGGVPAGIYTSCPPNQVQYIAAHCDAPIIVVENAEQLAKVRAVKAQLPKLQVAIVMDAVECDDEWVKSFDEVLALGAARPEREFEERLEALEPHALCTLIYTSGTTGPPKGVMLSHHNLIWTAQHLTRAFGTSQDDVVLCYLPLSHIAEQMVSIHSAVWNSFQVYFAQSIEKMPEHLREVRPTVFFGVPRVWEKFRERIRGAVAEASPRRQRLLAFAQKAALARHRLEEKGMSPNAFLGAQASLSTRLVHAKLKAKIGLDRAHLLATSTAPIGLDVLEFFASLDMPIFEAYGQSEVTGPTSVNTPHGRRLGTLGRPLGGLEVKIASDGEICVRGESVCLGYFKDAAATAELIDGEGWLHSGDVGELDHDGFLRITDRKKDLIVTSGGKKAAPQNLEALLRAIAPVSQAVVCGEQKNYLVALLTLERESAARFARERGLPADLEAIAKDPALKEHLQREIERVNGKLARFETIKKFVVLPNEFSLEAGELTPTLKVKRKVVVERYREVIESLYRV